MGASVGVGNAGRRDHRGAAASSVIPVNVHCVATDDVQHAANLNVNTPRFLIAIGRDRGRNVHRGALKRAVARTPLTAGGPQAAGPGIPGDIEGVVRQRRAYDGSGQRDNASHGNSVREQAKSTYPPSWPWSCFGAPLV